MSNIDPFDNPNFEDEEEYLNQLREDLSEKGYEVEWGEVIEENGKRSVKVIYEGNTLEDFRVPLNLEIINKSVGPISGYDMMLDTVESSLYYDQNDGDLPFLNQ